MFVNSLHFYGCGRFRETGISFFFISVKFFGSRTYIFIMRDKIEALSFSIIFIYEKYIHFIIRHRFLFESDRTHKWFTIKILNSKKLQKILFCVERSSSKRRLNYVFFIIFFWIRHWKAVRMIGGKLSKKNWNRTR